MTAMSNVKDGCLIRYQWTLKARVPLIGGALEKFIIGDMERRANDETRLALTMLDDYR